MKFSVADLLIASTIISCGFAACNFNTALTFVLVVALVLYFFFSAGNSSHRRIFLCVVFGSLILTKVAVEIYLANTFHEPDVPVTVSYLSSILYPVPGNMWTAYDVRRQCTIPIGGSIAIALGYLLTRVRTPNTNER